MFIGFDDPELLRTHMLAEVDIPFPFAVDRDRVAYRAWGLRRVPWRTVWLDPRVWWRYPTAGRWRASALRRGDTLQLGGDFVVAPDGAVAYSRPQVRDDRPPVGELISAASDVR
ncbi:MAG: hypothetical protein M3N57_10040 [Actinomycetota bacterium]|nr:hypothetical protein [Actinomycetota bacterium]